MSSSIPGWPRSAAHAPRVWRVGELNRVARMQLEDRFPDVWVEGEISDLTQPRSGHVYFTLCDVDAQLRAVMYRADAQRSRARLVDGARVRFRGSLTLFEPRGSFQFLARVALPAGEGDRAAEVARIRQKLAHEGLLDPAKKRKIPRMPRVIGLVTSRDGAAVHDLVKVALARFPVRIILAHCQVQGPDAPLSIISALRTLERVPELDVVVLARGGGAAEDLSAYDDERVARAVAECSVPTVSGVGHEVDVTLTDLVADVRASTPSNAAELVVPERANLRNELDSLERHLMRAMERQLGRLRLRLERLTQQVSEPRRRLTRYRDDLSALSRRIERIVVRRGSERRRQLDALRAGLAARDPQARLRRDRERFEEWRRRLEAAWRAQHARAWRELESLQRVIRERAPVRSKRARNELGQLAATLHALSPLAVLARGYAIAFDSSGKIVRSADSVQIESRLSLRLHEGVIDVEVRGASWERSGSEVRTKGHDES